MEKSRSSTDKTLDFPKSPLWILYIMFENRLSERYWAESEDARSLSRLAIASGNRPSFTSHRDRSAICAPAWISTSLRSSAVGIRKLLFRYHRSASSSSASAMCKVLSSMGISPLGSSHMRDHVIPPMPARFCQNRGRADENATAGRSKPPPEADDFATPVSEGIAHRQASGLC